MEGLYLKEEAIYRIYLFGSVFRETPSPTSDIDVVRIYYGNKKAIMDDLTESMLQTTLITSNQIEPILYSLEEFRCRQQQSLFLNQMDTKAEVIWINSNIKKKEIQNLYELAKTFFEGARDNLKNGRVRIALDAGYNAIELSFRALLLNKTEDYPSSHGELVTKFGELFIKTKEIDRNLGKQVNQALILRGKSCYDPLSTFEEEDGDFIIQTIEALFLELDKRVIKIYKYSKVSINN